MSAFTPSSSCLPPGTDRVLDRAFFARPAEKVAPDLVGALLVRRPEGGVPFWGVVVETEAYDQREPGCHGHRRRTPGNERLFGAPACFYVYLSYGIHHCVNVVTHCENRASGVLLRAVALGGEPERTAAGPALLARRFGIDRSFDGLPVSPSSGLWLATAFPPPAASELVCTTRIGLSRGQDLPWRWYLRSSRSVSRRAPGDRPPPRAESA